MLENPNPRALAPLNVVSAPFLKRLVVGLAMLGASATAAVAQSAGQVIPVYVPITGDSVARIKWHVEDVLKDFQVERARNPEIPANFTLVLDFNPKADGTRDDDAKLTTTHDDNPHSCEELADLISTMGRGKSINLQVYAYVHGTVSGHAVLPVLACPRILMAWDKKSKSQLGPVVSKEQGALEAKWRERYLAVAQTGTQRSKETAEEIIRMTVDRGAQGALDFEKANAIDGFLDQLARQQQKPLDTVHDVARALELPRAATLPLIPQHVTACKIIVRGEVDRKLKEKLNRLMRSAIREKKANLIVFDLQCSGGSLVSAYDIAEDLLQIKHAADDPVRVVGYYGPNAGNTALYLALATDHFFIDQEATLGEFAELLEGKNSDQRKSLGDQLESLAERQGYPSKLVRAFVDNDSESAETLMVIPDPNGGERQLVLPASKVDAAQRGVAEVIWKRGDELLSLDAAFISRKYPGRNDLTPAKLAMNYGLADLVITDGTDQVFSELSVDPNKVIVMEDDWLDQLARFLTSDWASFLLIMLGITCLILELKMPGVGLPGVLAALCFVLYFWSHSRFGGEITWLAILLFMLGLLLLAMEIFVLPGFGVCGISGLILALGSLGLMAYGHWPHSSKEWIGFSKSLTPYGFSLMGAIVLAVILARYLPNLPYFNRLILKPQSESQGLFEEEMDPQQARLTALLGAIGVAATPLRPAGKVQFGEEYVDVVAEGSYIVPGSRVQVIEIEGNRVVVKQV